MTHERRYALSDFDYELPPELIAQTPIEERSASRLLVVRRSAAPAGRAGCEDLIFSDLLNLIPAGDLLVLNTSRVRHARLIGMRPSGGPAEVLLIRPADDGSWLALGKPGSALQPGKRIELEQGAWVESWRCSRTGTASSSNSIDPGSAGRNSAEWAVEATFAARAEPPMSSSPISRKNFKWFSISRAMDRVSSMISFVICDELSTTGLNWSSCRG